MGRAGTSGAPAAPCKPFSQLRRMVPDDAMVTLRARVGGGTKSTKDIFGQHPGEILAPFIVRFNWSDGWVNVGLSHGLSSRVVLTSLLGLRE